MIISTSKRKGFTLIELLVVIAIIAILAAILFPVFAKAREKAKAATCMSNLKQMGMAIASYCQDYDEFMPVANTWTAKDSTGFTIYWIQEIYPYIAGGQWDGGTDKTLKVLFCPTDSKEIYIRGNGNKVTNYSYCKRLGNFGFDLNASPNYRPRTLAKCQSPSTCAVMVDGRCQSAKDLTWDVLAWDTATKFLDPRHNDGLNVLYADNHVKWFNLKSASQTEIDKTFKWGAVGSVQTDWPY